jgi:hypothetical protein
VKTAVTGRNWEGTGVAPDVPAAAGDALRSAQVLALRALLAKTPAGEWAEALKRALSALDRQPPP